MKRIAVVCLAIFLACELIGAWQGWEHLMIIGGGWLVLAILSLFSTAS